MRPAAVVPRLRSEPSGIPAPILRGRFGAMSGQVLLLGAFAIAAAIWVASVGLRSRHAFAYDAAPVLIAPLALWLFFSERYEVTLAVLLLYLGLLDGVVKLSSGSNLGTLGRDVLLYAITLGALVRVILRRAPVTTPPLTGIVVAWIAVCVLQLANPSDVSLSHAVASLRPHLEFVPLFFFGYVVMRSDQRLRGLLWLLLIVGAANGVVDLIQSHLTPAQLATWGPGYSKLEHGSGSQVARIFVVKGQAEVRPPGLGGTDGFGGLICLMALPAGIALLSSARHTIRLAWVVLPCMVLTVVGIVTSQSRLVVAGSIITLLVYLALTITSRRGLAVLALTVIVGLTGFVVGSAVISSSANRYASISPSRILGTALSGRGDTAALVAKYSRKYPLGAGIGSVGPAAGSGISGGPTTQLNGETEFSFLLVETGIPGLLVMLAFTLASIRFGLVVRRVADPEVQRALMAITAVVIFLFLVWYIAPTTADSPSSPFIWLSAGCLSYWYGQIRGGRLPLRPRRLRASLELR